jgi:hypothetical protein
MRVFAIDDISSPNMNRASLIMACTAAMLLGAIVGYIEAVVRGSGTASPMRGALSAGFALAASILIAIVSTGTDRASYTLAGAFFGYNSIYAPGSACLIFAIVFGLRIIGFRTIRLSESALRLMQYMSNGARNYGA